MTDPAPFSDADLALVHAVLEASPHSIVVSDDAGTITHANRRTLGVFGHTADELVGRPLTIILPDIHADLGEPHGLRRDGSTFAVELILAPLDTAEGRRIVTSIIDATGARADQQRLQELNRAYLTLARINQATVRARSPAELFAEACRVAVEEGGHLGAAVVRRGTGARLKTLATAGALDEYIARLDVTLDPADPRGRGPTARTLREGHAYFSADFATDPATGPWQELGASYGIRASAALPVRRGGRVVAAFTLWSATPHVFDERMRVLLESLVENLTFALDGFDAAARLERSVTQRGELLNRLVAAQEDERTRIAAMVHDDSVQALAAVDLRLGLLARRVEEAAPALSPMVAQLQATVGAVSGGLRHLLFELEPAGPDVPLVDLLHEVAGHVFEGRDLHWSVRAEPPAGPAGTPGPVGADLGPRARGQTVRIVREALVEVRDGAVGASRVGVIARDRDGGVEVTVTDNGTVDGLSGVDSPLDKLRDRAEIAGGWCRAERLDPGCELRFWLPREVPGSGRG